MPIKGITDREPSAGKFLAAKVHLGKRQENGRLAKDADLKTRFRIEPLNDGVRKLLKESYFGAEGFEIDNNGDIYVANLNIYAAYDDPEKTANAWMRAWSAQKLLRVCDRHTISQEWQEYVDPFGHTRSRMAECSLPCPIVNEAIQIDCPLGCEKEIILTFYIQELIEGIAKDNSYLRTELPCELILKGETNFQEGAILDQIKAIADRFGNVKLSPFPAGTVGNMIPCVLSRTKVGTKRPVLDTQKKVKAMVGGVEKEVGRRTGQKAKMDAFPVLWTVNPVYEARYIAWQRHAFNLEQARETKELGIAHNPLLLEAQLIPTEESAQSKCDRVKRAREQAKLTTEDVQTLLNRHFAGKTTPAQLTSQEVNELIDLIKTLV